MQRSPFQRILLAALPVLGAALAAFAAANSWPMLLSLLAMTVVTAAAAVIYWSEPLSEEPLEATASAAALPPVEVSPAILPALAAAIAEPQPELETTSSQPEPAAVGTRAEAIATGHWRETDLLTGLLNPDVFFARVSSDLERCRAAGQTAILAICDVDGFTAINNTAGLAEANHLLRRVGERFRLTVREGDALARLGGDEFGIFFPGLPPEIALSRARDLRAAVREAGLQVLEDGSPQVTACLGISSFPEDGDSVESLLAAANASLAAAKLERQQNADRPIPSALLLARP